MACGGIGKYLAEIYRSLERSGVEWSGGIQIVVCFSCWERGFLMMVVDRERRRGCFFAWAFDGRLGWARRAVVVGG